MKRRATRRKNKPRQKVGWLTRDQLHVIGLMVRRRRPHREKLPSALELLELAGKEGWGGTEPGKRSIVPAASTAGAANRRVP